MAFVILDGMKSSLAIDKAGRVVLPQEIRRLFHLHAGDRLDVEVRTDGILLRSRSQEAHLVMENGLLVHDGEATEDLARAVDMARENRDADMLGRPA